MFSDLQGKYDLSAVIFFGRFEREASQIPLEFGYQTPDVNISIRN